MADLTVVLHGDSHEGQEALHGAADASGHAHDAFGELDDKMKELKESFALGTLAAAAFEKGLETLTEVFKESWAEAAKAENAQRQLSAAAGEMTEQFQRQAEVIGANLSRKAEDIEQMQTLLLRYGAAPETIGKVIMAVENMAAQGKDANMVLQTMINAAENNTGSLGKLGVKFKETGDFAQNLAAAADAVNGKLGGAAEIEASGMAGRARAASNALDELSKAWGQLTGAMEGKLHVLQSVSQTLNSMAKGDAFSWIATPASIAKNMAQNMFGVGAGKEEVPTVTGENPNAAKGIEVGMGDVQLAPTDKAVAEAKKREEDYNKAWTEFQDKQWLAARKSEKDEIEAETEQSKNLHKIWEDDENYRLKVEADTHETYMKGLIQMDNLEREEFKQQTEQLDAEMKKRERTWAELGVKIGETLINGIVDAFNSVGSSGGKSGTKSGQLSADASIEKAIANGIWQIFMMAGGPVGMFGNMIAGAISGGSIGGGGGIGSLSQLFGNQKTTGNEWTNYGGSSESEWANPYAGGGDFSAPPMISSHSGSWVRFHGGGWPGLYHDERPVITQLGERILSRNEVSNAGGPAAVDRMARGGGGGSMTVYAFDSQSMLDFFGTRGGRSMLNTVRTGKGPMREMFGGS